MQEGRHAALVVREAGHGGGGDHIESDGGCVQVCGFFFFFLNQFKCIQSNVLYVALHLSFTSPFCCM